MKLRQVRFVERLDARASDVSLKMKTGVLYFRAIRAASIAI